LPRAPLPFNPALVGPLTLIAGVRCSTSPMCAVRYNCLSRVAGCAHSTVYLPLKCLNKQNNAIEGWLLCFITIKLFLRNKEKCEKTAFPLTPFFLLVKVFNLLSRWHILHCRPDQPGKLWL